MFEGHGVGGSIQQRAETRVRPFGRLTSTGWAGRRRVSPSTGSIRSCTNPIRGNGNKTIGFHKYKTLCQGMLIEATKPTGRWLRRYTELTTSKANFSSIRLIACVHGPRSETIAERNQSAHQETSSTP
jgi:hypothetical protein